MGGFFRLFVKSWGKCIFYYFQKSIRTVGGYIKFLRYGYPNAGYDPEESTQNQITLDFDVTPHQLRRTYITNLLYAGVDPKTVQYLAGHENSKTTMDIYAKVKYNKPEELFDVVNQAFIQDK